MHTRALLTAALLLLPACLDDEPGGFAPPGSDPGPQNLIVGPEVWFTQVAASSGFTCALRNDGAIECWGDNSDGQAPALKTAGSGIFVKLESRAGRTCAVRSDGAVECWDLGEDIPVWTPAEKKFVDVATNGYEDCAVRDDGAMECRGPLLTGSVVRQAIGVGYVDATVGHYMCAVKGDKTAECWFGNNRDQLAIPFPGYTQLIDAPYYRCWLTGSTVQCSGGFEDPPGGVVERTATTSYYAAFDAYWTHACALRGDGVIECWGDDTYGQAPAEVTAATGTFTQVSAGGFHSCALRSDGAVECWGNNLAGQAPAVRVATRERVTPTASFTAPASVIVTAPIALALTNAQVPGYPSATTFTFAFDCGTGSGYGAAGSTATASCPTTTAGTRTVKGKVIDQDGDSQEYRATVTVKSAQQGTADLRSTITTAPLAPDIRKALLAKLDAALKAIAAGKTSTACSNLADFINQVRAQRGKAIATATADAWIAEAQQLRIALGC